jgi:hypothetical protein
MFFSARAGLKNFLRSFSQVLAVLQITVVLFLIEYKKLLFVVQSYDHLLPRNQMAKAYVCIETEE